MADPKKDPTWEDFLDQFGPDGKAQEWVNKHGDDTAHKRDHRK